jgi:putative Mg2+ transporter-C (MgtC) family protein
MSNILNILNTIYYNDIFQIILKFFIIIILAGIVGIEREQSNKPAGFRTHVLVGISSVLVMLCGIELANMYGNNDPSRMPAQLLSGIGFIGAGTILSNGFKVKGLTTASGLLAITCIGLTVGAGMYLYAIIATIIVFFVLKYSYILNSNLDHISEYKFKVITKNPKEMLPILNEIISKYDVDIMKVKVSNENEAEEEEENEDGYILYDFKVLNTSFNRNQFVTEFAKVEKVKQVIQI